MARQGIGLRVANWRRIAAMTQHQLAVAVAAYLGRPCSQAYISMIESGKRAVTKRDLLFALAHGLRVSVNDLTGQPYPPSISVDLEPYVLASAVRAALDPEDEPSTPPRSVVALTAACDQAMAARMRCDFATLIEFLPGTLADAWRIWQASRNPEAGAVFARAAWTGSLALKPAGYPDLAIRLADLSYQVAYQLNDPMVQAGACFAVAQCALASGNRKRSLMVAATAADQLIVAADEEDQDPNGLWAWGTMLRLHAGLSASTLRRADEAAAHVAEAKDLATRVQGDPDFMDASLGNAGTWEVGIAFEIGEPDRAVSLARQVNAVGLRHPQRRSRLHLDTGRALFVLGDLDGAVTHLLEADRAAPGDLRHRPSAVEVVAQMARDAPTRGGSRALQELAARVGIDPLAPPVPA